MDNYFKLIRVGNDNDNCTLHSYCVTIGSTVMCTGPDNLCVGICGDGILAQQEQCDHGSTNGQAFDCCSSTCTYQPPSFLCRSPSTPCVTPGYCVNNTGNCSSITYTSNVTVCRASTSSCDITERCTGSSSQCPADAWYPVGTPCSSPNPCVPYSNCTISGIATQNKL